MHQMRSIAWFVEKNSNEFFRNKKKEYIKCLENRVAVLENQNKVIFNFGTNALSN